MLVHRCLEASAGGGALTRQHAGLAPKRHQARSSGRGGGRSSAIRGKVSGSIFANVRCWREPEARERACRGCNLGRSRLVWALRGWRSLARSGPLGALRGRADAM